MRGPGRGWWLAGLLVVATSSWARTPDISPPPKGHWAVDTTGRVTPQTLAELDALAAKIDAGGRGQLGVCVTGTTGGEVPRAYATRLFNDWGVGHRGSDDGVLLFVALDDHKSELVLGRGAIVTSEQTDVITSRDLVPNFKAGWVDKGLLAGATAVLDLLTPVRVDESLAALVRHELPFPERSPRSWVVDLAGVLSASDRADLDQVGNDLYAESKGRLFVIAVAIDGSEPTLPTLARAFRTQVEPLSALPLGVLLWDHGTRQVLLSLPAGTAKTPWEEQWLHARQAHLADAVDQTPLTGLREGAQLMNQVLRHGVPPRPTAEVLAQGFEEHWLALLATALGALALAARKVPGYLRRRPRSCQTCHRPRQLLGEAQEDAHLSKSQQVEEQLGSMDYDVWWCGLCHDALVLDYLGRASTYQACPRCKARARSSSSTVELEATEYAEGRVRVDERCAACDYHQSSTRVTARVVVQTVSSSSWDSSSSSSYDSGSSSSSSSDSSFGGGSSDGGGSSGSW